MKNGVLSNFTRSHIPSDRVRSGTRLSDHANHFLGQVCLFVKGQNKCRGISRPLHFVKEYKKKKNKMNPRETKILLFLFRSLVYNKESTQE